MNRLNQTVSNKTKLEYDSAWLHQWRQSWGLVVATPRLLAGGRGIAGGREILLYLIYVQEVCSKVVTFEENRIICPEVAINGQFLSGKSHICLIA